MLADLAPEGHALGRPLSRDLGGPLRIGCAHRGDGEAPRVEGAERDPKAVPLLPEEVLLRDHDVEEARHPVLNAAQAHERVAVLHGDAVGVHLDDEGGDAALVPLARWHPRHDDHELGDDSVGRPQLQAVQDVAGPVRGRHRGAFHPGGVGTKPGLGEQEGCDGARGAAREVPLLLFLGAVVPHRLRHPDRLVGRQQRGERGVHPREQHESAVVGALGQTKTAVLLGNLHPEGPEIGEPLQHVVRDDGGPLDLEAHFTPLGLAQDADLLDEGVALGPDLGRLLGERVDQVEAEPTQVQLLAERREDPLGLATGLGDLAGLELGLSGGVVRHDGSPSDLIGFE